MRPFPKRTIGVINDPVYNAVISETSPMVMKQMIKGTVPVLAVLFCLAAASVLFGGEKNIPGFWYDMELDSEINAEELFKSAFRWEIGTEESRRILQYVAEEYPDSSWADDALWMLARVADVQGDRAKAVLWRRRLAKDYPDPSLQSFTKERRLYRTSGIPGIIHLVESAGLRYAHERKVHVFSFNPLPFSLHYELGIAYQNMGYYGLAEREYRRALGTLPRDSILHEIVEERLEKLGVPGNNVDGDENG